jgi:hypothetical protein
MEAQTTRTVAIALAAAAVVGLLHTPFARPWLARFAGCPFAVGRMTPAQADAARHMALATVPRDEDTAPVRPALGFALDVTTLADARRWARRHAAHCEEPREALLRCTGVTPDALGLESGESGVDELALEFDPHGHLVTATTFRTRLTAEAASITARGIAATLSRALGRPTRQSGGFGVDHLLRPAAESIATLAYRYGDYTADVEAVRLGSGVALREQYMSGRD